MGNSKIGTLLWNKNDTNFCRPMLKIGVPIMMGQLLSYSLNLIDSIMIGRVGELEYSAVALANQPFFIVFLCICGLGGGMGIMISQYYGKGDSSKYTSIFGAAAITGLLITGMFAIFVRFYPMTVMAIYTPDPVLQAIGADYLKIASLCYVFAGFSALIYNACRNVGNVKFGLYCSVMAIATNTILNYCLIFGKFGFPKMGVQGAALATVIARTLEIVVASIYLFKYEKTLRIKLFKMFKVQKEVAVDFTRYAIPVMLNDTIWVLLATTYLMIVGRMGSANVAAWSINSAIQDMTFVASIAFGVTTSIIISQTVGASEYVRAGYFTKSSIKISMYIGIIGGGILFFAAPQMLGLYKVTPEALEIAKSLFFVLPFVFFTKSMATVIVVGILRGAGDTKMAAIIDVAPMFVSIPLGFLAAIVLKQPLWVVYICLSSEALIKTVTGMMRINRGNFIKNLTRD